MKNANKRYRTFELILYPDNLIHLTLLDFLRSHFKYALILHDKDLTGEGEKKKNHYHVLIYYENAKTESSVRRFFSDNQLIDNVTLINYKNDLKQAVRYLLHIDNNDKAQYTLDEIESNFEINSYFNNLISNETLDIQLIRQIIYSYKESITMSALYEEVINNNLWSSYRRNYTIIKDLVYEHNLIFTSKE